MTYGQLYDALEAIREAEAQVLEAQRALDFGGSVGTMVSKRNWLQACKERLQLLREEEMT